MGGGSWLKMSYRGRRLAEKVRIPTYGRGGLKLLKKPSFHEYDI